MMLENLYDKNTSKNEKKLHKTRIQYEYSNISQRGEFLKLNLNFFKTILHQIQNLGVQIKKNGVQIKNFGVQLQID